MRGVGKGVMWKGGVGVLWGEVEWEGCDVETWSGEGVMGRGMMGRGRVGVMRRGYAVGGWIRRWR